MIGLVTLYESGCWVASGTISGGRKYDASSVRSYAGVTLSDGGGAVMVVSFEIHKGDFTCHEAVDLNALRCLQKLMAFLGDA